MKRLIVFDLDGTLAESKAPLDAEMAALLLRLLEITKVAVISGGGFAQFEAQLLSKLSDAERLKSLSLLPTCGTRFFAYAGTWVKVYEEVLTASEKRTILSALKRACSGVGLEANEAWGEVIEDRGTQITFSALGQEAPLEAKVTWDPDFAKRKRIKAVLNGLIPEFSVGLGGTTSVDITRLGIDKAYGIHKLRDILGISLGEMLFIGDALFVGGNDRRAMDAGVTSIQVRDPNETKRVIETLVACLERRPGAALPARLQP